MDNPTKGPHAPDASVVKHHGPTPGPWRAVPEWLHDGKFHSAGRSPLVQQVDGAPIADCRRSSIYGRDEVAEANARLIAAAPDMLAALLPFARMANQIDEWQRGAPPEVHFSFDADELRRARAAIAKATGAA